MDTTKYTKEEFAKECSARGYMWGGKQAVLRWCKDHPKEYYTEDDMIAVYRYSEANKMGGYVRPQKKSVEQYFDERREYY